MSTRDDEMIEAAKNGRLDDVRRLLGEDPALAGARRPSGETAVIAGLYRGHTEIVDALIRACAPLDLFGAAATGQDAAVAAALRTDPTSVNAISFDGWTPLHLAAFFGKDNTVRALLDAGADVLAVSTNSMKNTSLHAAIAGNHPEIALLLIERGADVDARDAGGHTPMHIAAESGSVNVVKALLARGADPHAVDAEDKTPLSRAAARNQSAVIDAINE